VIDPLSLLDDAIDRLTSSVCSRCSQTVTTERGPTGTPKPLKSDTVPVVPVVPVQNGPVIGSDEFLNENSGVSVSPQEKTARTSTILKRMEKTGTTGTTLEKPGFARDQIFFENGHNGNRSGEPTGSRLHHEGASDRVCDQGGEEGTWGEPGLPRPGCGGGVWWRLSVISGGPGPWHCTNCNPPHPDDWVDGCAVCTGKRHDQP